MRRPHFIQRHLLQFLVLICLPLGVLVPAHAQTVAPAAAAAALHDPTKSMLPDARGAVPWSLLSAATIKMQKGKLGPQSTLLTVLSLVGVEGVTQPLLPKRPR